MRVLIPVFLVVGAAFAPLAHAQRSTHAAMHVMNSQHNGMAMPAINMGMSGMDALKGQSGKAFNIAFMSQMIAHHQATIEMSEMALKQSDRAEVKQLAQNIIKAQKAEITRYKSLLHHVK